MVCGAAEVFEEKMVRRNASQKNLFIKILVGDCRFQATEENAATAQMLSNLRLKLRYHSSTVVRQYVPEHPRRIALVEKSTPAAT